mgnify:CR=1 FL=1
MALRGPRPGAALQTIAMPADTNANGDIFGGWLMGQMDLGASVLARTLADGTHTVPPASCALFAGPHAGGCGTDGGEATSLHTRPPWLAHCRLSVPNPARSQHR